ncbi:MFS transporter [Actinomadura sp. NBRC 104425]|uniref:MFS transporter n=1 Tax=Actinomadura sp. NBRC 104425 TaxID=3032204 RepID=UPI0024A237E7|nr:MFS transporter [Actinomadura sp. NBRC 104425]GLZ14318.1 MFS transporter [Actinomadura sp. NBRC 104425]
MRRAVLRKVTRRFMPLIGLCYIVLYVDRQNIGIAALTMNDDLGISATAFGFAAGVYFWSYTLCEPPSNYVLAKVGARVWIPRIMVTWGLVTMAMALVTGQLSLTVMRLLLGIAEAGFSPGMLYFVSRWYPKAERGASMSWIVTFICLSALASPLCTHVMIGMDGLAGMAGWRWLFIVTGVPAVLLGPICYRVLRDRPAKATFLSPSERSWLQRTLDAESEQTARTGGHSFRQGLSHPRVLALIAVFCCVTFSLNGYQLWLPQIIKEFGLTTLQTGWLVAVPPMLAIGPMLWWTRHSDRTRERGLHFAGAAGVCAAGFAVAAVFLHSPVVAMAGFCVAGIGLYASLAIFITMPSSFLTGAALAAGFGLINGLGNVGGYFGPQVTGFIQDSTGGFTWAVAAFGAVMLVAAGIVLPLTRRAGRSADTGRGADPASTVKEAV